MKNKYFWLFLIILVIVALSGFAAGWLVARESNTAPIIIERCSG